MTCQQSSEISWFDKFSGKDFLSIGDPPRSGMLYISRQGLYV